MRLELPKVFKRKEQAEPAGAGNASPSWIPEPVEDTGTISTDDLVERSGDLKEMLVAFGERKEFAEDRKLALPPSWTLEMDILTGLQEYDSFLMTWPLSTGGTVLERFVAAHPELPPDERAMLLGWRNQLDAFFDVVAWEGPALLAVNTFDDLTYRIRNNLSSLPPPALKPGTLFTAHIVPVRDVWVLSGASEVIHDYARDETYDRALNIATDEPWRAFTNPDHLRRAWELQREDRDRFIAQLGSDFVFLSTEEFCRRMDAYRLEGARVIAARRGDPPPAALPPALRATLPEDAEPGGRIGVMYDETYGLIVQPSLDGVEEIFRNPDLLRNDQYLEMMALALADPNIPPVPLHRLAERNPANADRVARILLGTRTSTWSELEELLWQTLKARWTERDPEPYIIYIGERLSRFRDTGKAPDPVIPATPGRNERCPCGSGKKYKACCGRA